MLERQKILLQIITPEEVLPAEKADMIIMHCTTGDFGVLPGHAPLSALLGRGAICIYNGGEEEHRITVSGGFAFMQDNVLTVITNEIRPPLPTA